MLASSSTVSSKKGIAKGFGVVRKALDIRVQLDIANDVFWGFMKEE